MVEITAEDFFALKEKFTFIPYSQSRNWHDYLIAKGESVIFYVDNLLTPEIAIMGKVKRIPIIGKVLIVEGELLSDKISDKLITNFYNDLAHLRYNGFEINSVHNYFIDYEIGIRRAGFVRPISQTYCPLSIILDFDKELEFNKNWKRYVEKAKKSELSFLRIEKPTLDNLLSFKVMFSEMAKLKNLKYSLNPQSLLKLVGGKDMRLYSVVNSKGSPVASNIVYVDRDYSAYVYAANSFQSRRNGASYYLLQSVFEELRNEGIKYFDLSRIPPSNNSSDTIYIFKNSVKGLKVQYNGEWAFYHNIIKEYIMHFGKIFIAHKQRY